MKRILNLSKKMGSLLFIIASLFVFTGQAYSGEVIFLYPDGLRNLNGPLNPRIPYIPPVHNGYTGRAMPVETNFLYHLSPYIDLTDGSEITFVARDNKKSGPKDILQFISENDTIIVRLQGPFEDRRIVIAYKRNTKKINVASTKVTIRENWKKFKIKLNDKNVVLINSEDNKIVSLELEKKIICKFLRVNVWHIDDLQLNGNGIGVLDWDSGYAMRLNVAQKNIVEAKLFGFDTMFISNNKENRDYPMVQIINGKSIAQKVKCSFRVTAENNEEVMEWDQEIIVAPRSSQMQSVNFPVPLKTDIYHLYMNTTAADSSIEKHQKHFVFIQKRLEPLGPNKFGLHDYDNSVFGYWPDALPINLQHIYVLWGYVIGPPWEKFKKGEFEKPPETPSEKWNWDPRLDWAVLADKDLLVCLQADPFFPWMREEEYEKKYMHNYPWGLRGGRPSIHLYGKFVREFSKRYAKKIKYYEVENEPNVSKGYSYVKPSDYTDLLKIVSENVRLNDSSAKILGISGTGYFDDYMKNVFGREGYKYIDGVSWHSYTLPYLPAERYLESLLKKVTSIVGETGKRMIKINSETGTCTAPRYVLKEPIPKEKVQHYINIKKVPFVTDNGNWPFKVFDEWKSSKYIIRQVVYNFLEGVEVFTFFGWNPHPSVLGPWEDFKDTDLALFSIFSRSKDGTPTPNLVSLSAGVLIEQFKSVLPGTGRYCKGGSIKGGYFEKVTDGELAVFWSDDGRRSIVLMCDDDNPEVISCYGKKIPYKTIVIDGRNAITLEVSEFPVYIHSKIRGMELLNYSFQNYQAIKQSNGLYKVQFTLNNPFNEPLVGPMNFYTDADKGGSFSLDYIDFKINPGGVLHFTNYYKPKRNQQYRHRLYTSITLPNTQKHMFIIPIQVRPTVFMNKLADNIKTRDLKYLIPVSAQLHIAGIKHVLNNRGKVYGRNMKQYNGLSAKVMTGYNNQGLHFYIEVFDPHPVLSKNWPDNYGSSVELFFDFRDSQEIGKFQHSKDVEHIAIQPALNNSDKFVYHNYSVDRLKLLSDQLRLAKIDSKFIDKTHYYIAYHIPWSVMPKVLKPGDSFGFDVVINGVTSEEELRNIHMALFGKGGSAGFFGVSTLDH
jgi:hypothetical protein